MPLFIFKCRKCGTKKEELLNPSNNNFLMTCDCGGAMEKEFPTGSIDIMRGPNWVGGKLKRKHYLKKMKNGRYDFAYGKGH